MKARKVTMITKTTSRRMVFMLTLAPLLLCAIVYFLLPQEGKWLISAPVDVPLCNSRTAQKFSINSDVGTIREHFVSLLHLGMTKEEVENSFRHIAPIKVINSFTDSEGAKHEQILVQICGNPLGNVLLSVRYSKEGFLINARSSYSE